MRDVPEDPATGGPPPRPAATGGRDLNTVGQIAFAILAGWVAIVAIPGRLPWESTEDSQRVALIGLVITTIVALVGLALAWTAEEDTAKEGGRIGIWAGRLGILLVALDVTMVMLIPADAPYRQAALGIGLLVILLAAFLALSGPIGETPFTGLRMSNVSIVTTIAALGLVGAYLVAVDTLFPRAADATDPQWVKYKDLLSGIETLAFAAAGALFGNAVQRQVTGHVQDDLGAADGAIEDLNAIVDDTKAKAQSGELVPVEPLVAPSGPLEELLMESNVRYVDAPDRRAERLQGARVAMARPSATFVADLQQRQDRANRRRRRR